MLLTKMIVNGRGVGDEGKVSDGISKWNCYTSSCDIIMVLAVFVDVKVSARAANCMVYLMQYWSKSIMVCSSFVQSFVPSFQRTFCHKLNW